MLHLLMGGGWEEMQTPPKLCSSFYKSNKRLLDVQEGRWKLLVSLECSQIHPHLCQRTLLITLFESSIFHRSGVSRRMVFLMGTLMGADLIFVIFSPQMYFWAQWFIRWVGAELDLFWKSGQNSLFNLSKHTEFYTISISISYNVSDINR